ncbi:hypothetical protein Rhe02_33850 [Rhizocola hellebori]|uniref:Uncharacterized protein n=1 Tax=Rhizocola hellebori TaxID=1392758 RepID=A0A8J3Q8T3_9ACTN|nr:hypothetical protein [Rhizocola hellebori]GIH05318.1 hypothetical protein Rhe02_33850 [Rhizocola hellebori]
MNRHWTRPAGWAKIGVGRSLDAMEPNPTAQAEKSERCVGTKHVWQAGQAQLRYDAHAGVVCVRRVDHLSR